VKRNAIDAVFVVLVGVGWGLLAPATKALFAADPAAFDGLSVAVARAAWALPMFLVIFAVTFALERPRLAPRRWLAIAGAGALFGFGISVVFSIAAQHTSVAHISFLIGTSPVTNSLAAALAFRLPIGRRQRIALALGVIGVTLLATAQNGGHAGLFGDSLMLIWLAAFAAYAVLLRCVGPSVSSTFTMSAVGVVAMASVLLVGLVHPAGLRGAAHVIDTPASAWWFFGEIVGGSTLIAQTAYARSVRRLGVSIATIGAEYTALAVGITASILSREPWSIVTVIAGLILCTALAVTFVPLPARWVRAARVV
jgi:drug/metabolite transporter (DMT)-like permease